jgi:threonine dehydrogenase-like Zn-dependent dehydrogenase
MPATARDQGDLAAEVVAWVHGLASVRGVGINRGGRDIVEERGDEGVSKIKELTGGLGAHSVIEAVGTQESFMQAIRSTRPGGHVGYVGVAMTSSCLARNCSSLTCTCTAAPPRCAASCPNSSS